MFGWNSRNLDTELIIAHHEAGHAVIAHAAGFKVEKMLLHPSFEQQIEAGLPVEDAATSQSNAITFLDMNVPKHPSKSWIKSYVNTKLAGLAVEELLFKTNTGGSNMDWQEAKQGIFQGARQGYDPLELFDADELERLVMANEEKIRKVGTYLFENHVIDAATFEELVA